MSTTLATNEQPKPQSAIALFEKNLGQYNQTVIDLLGEKYGISQKEFIVSAINAVKKTPKLLECSPQTLFGSILLCAELGLKFNTPEGFCYILPYNTQGRMEAQFQLGYKGIVEIMYRSPRIVSVDAEAVYENDDFQYALGTGKFIKHTPCMEGPRGKLKCVYAVVKLKDSDEPLFKVVHKEELDKIKKLSKAGNSQYSPYNNGTDIFNTMEAKAAIKLLSKYLPKSDPTLSKAISIDNRVQGGAKVVIEEGVAEVVDSKTTEIVTIEELKAAFDLKGEFLSPEDQINVERIIKNSETLSYNKAMTLLNQLG